MKNHRLAVTGLAVFAAASLALAGCSASSKTTDSPGASASPSVAATQDASASLSTALTVFATKGFDFTETLGAAGSDTLTGNGTIDPATKSASIMAKGVSSGTNVEFDVVKQDTNLWVKIDAGSLNASVGLPNTWMTVDPTKITKTDSIPFDLASPDVLDLAGLFTSVANVAFTDPSTISGTVDLTKATGTNAPDISDYAAQAAATPFTVKLDASGYPTAVTVDTSSYDKSSAVGFTFSNVGSPSAITAPTGASPAPDGAYSFLNGS